MPLSQGQLDKAATLARRILAGEPGAIHAHMILGVIAAQKNDWAESNRHFQTVVRLEPANPYGYFYLGQAKLYQHDWNAAIEYFSKALERQYPETERLLVELATAQNEAGHPGEALETLQKVAAPADARLAAQYHALRAFSLNKLDRSDAAIEAIQQALQFDENTAENWELLIGELTNQNRSGATRFSQAEALRYQVPQR